MTFGNREPKPETLGEFALYSELVTEAGKAVNGLDDALIEIEKREAARDARRPSRDDLMGGRR